MGHSRKFICSSQMASILCLYMFKGLTCFQSDLQVIMPDFRDDMTIPPPSSAESDLAIAKLRKHFTLRDLGPTSWILRIKIIGFGASWSLVQQCETGTLSLSKQLALCTDSAASTHTFPSTTSSEARCFHHLTHTPSSCTFTLVLLPTLPSLIHSCLLTC